MQFTWLLFYRMATSLCVRVGKRWDKVVVDMVVTWFGLGRYVGSRKQMK